MTRRLGDIKTLRCNNPAQKDDVLFTSAGIVAGVVIFLLTLPGCTTSRQTPQGATAASTVHEQSGVPLPPQPARTDGGQSADRPLTQPSDEGRLQQLWQRRSQDQGEVDYPFGPGDTIEVSVAALPEITNKVVRVSRAGTITLPLIGKIHAGGLTEEGLSEEIRRRLAAEYMHDPQVNLLVREYRSRQVAVVGAVEKPGLYSLGSDTDTLLDMISLAGGMQRDAGRYIRLIPAEPVEKDKVQVLATTFPQPLRQQGFSPVFLKRTEPLVIDSTQRATATEQLYLAIPARPGDILIVPGAGEVMIEGWVERPGTYKVTANTTVSAVIAAAGGPLYAADTSTIKVIRTNNLGVRASVEVDLAALKQGQKADLPVQDGDIIEVSSSSPKLLPYGFYRLLTSVVQIGGSIPLY
jgi:polysaccharide biosynthesis/export protein